MDKGAEQDVLELSRMVFWGGSGQWGLYVSSRWRFRENQMSLKPGTLCHPSPTIPYSWRRYSQPLHPPNMDQLIGGLNYGFENNYPARGTYAVGKLKS
jgi:hypothetical protein